MFRFALACALAVAAPFVAGGCAGARPAPPPIAAAPAELAGLRFHVENANDAAVRDAGESDVTTYDVRVRAAVERSLVRAGYVVVVDAREPHDLVARIKTTAPAARQGGVASLTLEGKEGIIAQITGIIELDERSDIDERGPVAMVEAITRAPGMAAFAERRAAERKSAP